MFFDRQTEISSQKAAKTGIWTKPSGDVPPPKNMENRHLEGKSPIDIAGDLSLFPVYK
jgi:hypothetical protein